MNRAYSLLDVKSISETSTDVVIKGMASTPTMDRMDDVVEPMGAKFKTPMPLLWQHDAHKPVGLVTFAKPNSKGIPFEARLPIVREAGILKDRIDEAVQSMRHGLVAAVSIGFQPVVDKIERIKGGGLRFLEWTWIELSLVTIPANSEATITSVKSIDARHLAALGKKVDGDIPPALGRNNSNTPPNPKGNKMNYTNESLATLKESRENSAKRMDELLQAKGAEGFNDEQRDEFNGLKATIADLDDQIDVCAVHVKNIATAKPVDTRTPSFHVKKADPDDKFKGQAFTRKIMAQAIAHLAKKSGNYIRPSEVAQARWGKSHPQLVAVMKANEVAGGGTGSGEWGAELVQIDTRYTGDFIDFLYAKTVFDRLPLREVPARSTIKGRDGESTGFWTGESKAIKVTTGNFSNVNTTPYKVGAIVTMSKELIEDSDPSVELLMRDGLEEALRQRVDSTFLSTSAVSAGVSPAGILNGLSIGSTNGPDEQSARTDYRALMANFVSAKNLDGLYWVTTPTLAVGLGSMVNALGQPSFPTVMPSGGTYMGFPMITGDNVGTGDFILLKPSDIWKIGDMGVNVQVSDSAMIEQSAAPTGEQDTPVAASQYFVSMYQEDAVALKVTRRISWGLRRSTAVAYIGNAAYGAENS